MSKCIFCESESNSYNRVEHLVPESLGGDIILPQGLVCDNCNQYFGRSVEQKALNTPVLSFMRTYLGVPNKKLKQRRHDGFQFTLEGRFPEPSLFSLPSEKLKYVLKMGRGQILIPPYVGIASICRLLLKMGVEYLASSPTHDIFAPEFKAVRKAAREPKTGTHWCIACSHLHPNDINQILGVDSTGEFVHQSVYTINLAVEQNTDFLGIHFIYGFARYIVPLKELLHEDFNRIVIRHNLINLNEYPFEILCPDISKLD